MTTFQDPPHQSRRAVRHSERTEPDAPGTSATASEVDAPSTSSIPTRTGRRAQLPSGTDSPESTVEFHEPMTFVTPTRPQVPSYDAPSTPLVPVDGAAEAAPHGRRVSLPAGEQPPAPVDIVDEAPAAVETTADDAAQAPAAPTVIDAPPAYAVPMATPDQPMTRRQLRELREKAEAEAAAAEASAARQTPEAILSLVNSGPIVLPYLDGAPRAAAAVEPTAAEPSEVDDSTAAALAEFDSLTREPSEGTADTAPAAADERVASPIATWGLTPSSAADAADDTDTDSTAIVAEIVEDDETADDETADDEAEVAAAQNAADEPVVPVATATARSEDDDDDDDEIVVSTDSAPISAVPTAVATAPASVDPIFIEPGVSAREPGHWSVQNDDDEDEIDAIENTFSRTVGSTTNALTTSALVMPSIPQSSDLTTPYLATGEIMITGSIDLPRSLAATGAHPHRVDNSDFESDPMDREVLSTDSAPVRAIRAVSTHTGSNGMIVSRKPQGNRTLTILVISASTMAVGVAGLLIAGISLGFFG